MEAVPAVHFFGEIDSTNSYLRRRLERGEAGYCAVWSRIQQAGRGRLGRTWYSPEGGLYYSIVAPVGQVPPTFFTIATGLAAYEILSPYTAGLSLKWPNDLLVTLPDGEEERKLGGILSEFVTGLVEPAHVIVGLGLNINAKIELPADAGDGAPTAPMSPISLSELTGMRHELSALVAALHQRLHAAFVALEARHEAQEELLKHWREATSTLGKVVRVYTPGEVIEGIAREVTSRFTLLVETTAGEREIQAGDCVHLRPSA